MQHLSTTRRANATVLDWPQIVGQLLKVTGKTPAELATELGTSRQAVYRWLKAETTPRRTQQQAMMVLALNALTNPPVTRFDKLSTPR